MRPVLEVAGVKDIIAKSLGSSNRINLAKATILALSQLRRQAPNKPAGTKPEEKTLESAEGATTSG
jgi:small subunit ribosomal protein S5